MLSMGQAYLLHRPPGPRAGRGSPSEQGTLPEGEKHRSPLAAPGTHLLGSMTRSLSPLPGPPQAMVRWALGIGVRTTISGSAAWPSG